MDKESPLLSVALITYNQEEFIRACLDGMVVQKVNFPFEIVIGEDCSTDNTREICLEYKQKYPELIRLNLPAHNLGMMGNWITTIQACKGKYIAICEGDDYWIDDHKLQKQFDFLESNPDFSLCATASKVYAYGNFTETPIKASELSLTDILLSDWGLMTATLVFRKDSLAITDWFYKVKNGDYALQLLTALKGKIKCLPDVTSVYRQHPGGVSNKLTAFIQCSWIIYLLWEFNNYTEGKYLNLIKKKIKRVYKNQIRFAKENKLRKAYVRLLLFRFITPFALFYIRKYR